MGRRHGNAVRRARIKRHIREVFRRTRLRIPGAPDLVSVPRVARRLDAYDAVESALIPLAGTTARIGQRTPSCSARPTAPTRPHPTKQFHPTQKCFKSGLWRTGF